MKNAIILNQIPRPRDKERYETDEPLTFLLADDFQEDIRDSINIALKEANDTRFPLSGASSIFLDYYTDRSLSAIGILKNVLDSSNRLLISDDKKVKSALVRRFPAAGEKESIQLSLISTRDIMNIKDTVDAYKTYILFSKDIETTLEDRYLPYSKSISVKDAVDVNYYSDKIIARCIRELYNGPVTIDTISLAIEITTKDDCGDLDNIALNYISNCKGIIFKDIVQIQNLLIIKKISTSEKPSIKISWE